MDRTSYPANILIQVCIIPLFFYKINPFFDFFPKKEEWHFLQKATSLFCQEKNFSHKKTLVKNVGGEKSRFLLKSIENHYVNRKNTSSIFLLFPPSVEKAVDNVEKSILTSRFPLYPQRFPQAMQGTFSTFSVPFPPAFCVTETKLYLRFFNFFGGKTPLQTVRPSPFSGKENNTCKIFVKNCQTGFSGIIPAPLEILLTTLSTQEVAMQGKVEICGVNTARLTQLSPQEMDKLLRRAAQGDEQARQALIEGNLRLVLSVIQRFDKRGENPDDLFQVGCIGLIKAISNFDPSKNVRFSTYGVPMIAGEVRRYLRDNSAIRVSRSIRDIAYRVLQCKEALTGVLGREPTLEEISGALELPQGDVSEALDAVCAPISLYDPVYSDGGDPLTVMDQVWDTKNNESCWMEHIALRNAFARLNGREKQILSMRFYDGKTQMEVAGLLGISQAQVSRLEKGAIRAMRKGVSIS